MENLMECFNLVATDKNPQEVAGDEVPTPGVGGENDAPMELTTSIEFLVPALVEAKPMFEGAETGEAASAIEASTNGAPPTDGTPTQEASPTNVHLVSVEVANKPRKKSSVLKEKKLRQNRLLRQTILPRNAFLALKDLKGITVGNFSYQFNEDGGFKTMVTVNTAPYEGQGTTMMAAKNAACEKALCDYMSHKIKPMPSEADGDAEEETNYPGDDKSMLSLASFAIYKLFSEWEREGFPMPGMSLPAYEAAEPPTTRTGFPKGWETMHPVSLLCLLRPNIQFVDVDNSSYTNLKTSSKRVRVTVDSHSFVANGRSKKIARRIVATNACNKLFGTNFSYPDTS